MQLPWIGLKPSFAAMSDIGLKATGVESAVAFPGLSISGFSVAPMRHRFLCLKPFEERKTAELAARRLPAR